MKRRTVRDTLALLGTALVVFGLLIYGGWRWMHHKFTDSWSGSTVPAEAKHLTYEQRVAETRRRVESVRETVLRYQSDHGRLPNALAELVPSYLPEIPSSLVSTQPIRYVPNTNGFIIRFEAFPDAMYEHHYIDQDGNWAIDS